MYARVLLLGGVDGDEFAGGSVCFFVGCVVGIYMLRRGCSEGLCVCLGVRARERREEKGVMNPVAKCVLFCVVILGLKMAESLRE